MSVRPSPPFQIRGAVEGFYGVFYTAPERDDLIRFLGEHGFTHYIYGPKNDRQHRARWREPYPDMILNQFAQTVAVAREAGVTFAYALSPGVSICYSGEGDFAAITSKFEAFYEHGVRCFYLFLDDIAQRLHDPADDAHYPSYADAHADLCNRIYAWLQALDPAVTLGMCPTGYHGTAPFSEYVHTLGTRLEPAIDVFYTGPDICTPTITADDAHAFATAIKRPPLIWDNYPVNDLAMQPDLHIGPLQGRDPALGTAVKGLVSNLMIQAEASKIPLHTIAAYLADPLGYDPQAAWDLALHAVAGGDSAASLRTLAENALSSCLGTLEAPLDQVARAMQDEIEHSIASGYNDAAADLQRYLTALDEACYHLKFRMQNLALRNNLLPWIELIEHRLWLGRWTLQVWEAYRAGDSFKGPLKRLRDTLQDSRRHPKRIGGARIEQLAEYVLEQVKQYDNSFTG